jgi:hypothetical protein
MGYSFFFWSLSQNEISFELADKQVVAAAAELFPAHFRDARHNCPYAGKLIYGINT